MSGNGEWQRQMTRRRRLITQLTMFMVMGLGGICILLFLLSNPQIDPSPGPRNGYIAGAVCGIIGIIGSISSFVRLRKLQGDPHLSEEELMEERAEKLQHENEGVIRDPLIGRKVTIAIGKNDAVANESPEIIVGIIRREVLDLEGNIYSLIERQNLMEKAGNNLRWYLAAPAFEMVEMDTLFKMQENNIPVVLAGILDISIFSDEPFDAVRMKYEFIIECHLSFGG